MWKKGIDDTVSYLTYSFIINNYTGLSWVLIVWKSPYSNSTEITH